MDLIRVICKRNSFALLVEETHVETKNYIQLELVFLLRVVCWNPTLLPVFPLPVLTPSFSL